MRSRFRFLAAAGIAVVTLGPPAVGAASPAAADDMCMQTGPGVYTCTSPGHGSVNVSPSVPRETFPGFGGYGGGPYFVPYW